MFFHSQLSRLLCVALLCGAAVAREPSIKPPPATKTPDLSTNDRVGKVGLNRYYTPTNQIITPTGIQVELPGIRPQAIALSPDGKLLVTAGKTAEIIVIDPKTGAVLQKVAFPGKQVAADATEEAAQGGEAAGVKTKPDGGAQLSYTGLVFSPDGKRIYVSNVNGDVKVFAVDPAGKVSALRLIVLPEAKAPKRKAEIPAGLAVSRDGRLLYVAFNLANKLAEIDTTTGVVLRTWETGVAPFDVVLAAGKAYVSNWGGRRPGKGDLTGPAGRGTTVRVDPVRSLPSEGSVTIVNLAEGKVKTELLVELRPGALAVSPDERYVVVANTGSDTLSVIDSKTDAVVEKIWTRPPPDLFSAMPNALAFDKSGKRLYVCNAAQNAVSVILFDAKDKESTLLGLIPVGWFPGAIVHDPVRNQLCVGNIKGIGSTKKLKPGDKPKLSSKDYYGTVSIAPVPDAKELTAHTAVSYANIRQEAFEAAKLPARPGQPARPVPERVGEPSVFKHVIYIIKENRTYDQVLGDVKRGNGDATLCTFGEKFTPNQHKLVREFVVLDNTYCSGIQSADGHHWTDAAIAMDYIERGHAGWPRSYPNLKTEDSMDALAYSPAGFIWDNILKHGKTLRNYGEACISECGWSDRAAKGKPKWKDYHDDVLAKTGLTSIRCKPGLDSLRPFFKPDTVGWDLGVPDIVRASRFIDELHHFERTGKMPDFIIMALPNDHTGGTGAGTPTPAAQVADNDLAMGQIVEALSHSKFWPDTCLFAIEDDPQNGWDHISGYRTTCYVVSPYTKRSAVVSTQYNQTSLVRTMELMLGIPPMNIMDATATPMNDCFTDTPDLTPFTAVPNQVSLLELNPEKKKNPDPKARKDAATSASLNLREPDRCPEDVLNRILWRAMKGTKVPYPEWAITKVDDDD